MGLTTLSDTARTTLSVGVRLLLLLLLKPPFAVLTLTRQSATGPHAARFRQSLKTLLFGQRDHSAV